jgi:hypothetical protein
MPRRSTFTLLLVIVLAVAVGLPAGAWAGSPSESGHASARTERLAVQAAGSYWLQKGRAACLDPRIEYVALSKRAAGDAFIGPNLPAAYCVIRLSTRYSWRGRAGALDFCWTVVHERGHQTGLEHARSGIMRSDGGERPPAICTQLFGKRAG